MHIIIYTKTNCGWAEDVKDFLRTQNIPFDERNIFQNPAYEKEVLEKTGQSKSPTLDIDGHLLPDSDVDQVKAYLTERGVLQ